MEYRNYKNSFNTIKDNVNLFRDVCYTLHFTVSIHSHLRRRGWLHKVVPFQFFAVILHKLCPWKNKGSQISLNKHHRLKKILPISKLIRTYSVITCLKQKLAQLTPAGFTVPHVWPSNEVGCAAVAIIIAVAKVVRVVWMKPAHRVYPSNRFSTVVPKTYPLRTMPLQMTMIKAAMAFKIVGQTVEPSIQAELVL